MSSPRIGLLGPLTLDGVAAVLAPRDRVVLAALAMRSGEVLSSAQLADALWGEVPPASWRKVVPGCVMRLRRTLGASSIETSADGYRLVLSDTEVDACSFGRLVSRAQELLTLGEPERAAHHAGEALEMWRGRPLADLDGWAMAQIESTRLEELRLEAEELHLEAAIRAGRYRSVLVEAQARVVEAPLRERRWALLATTQYQAGRQADALRTLHRARMVLATELGIDPGPDLVVLEGAILRQDPSLEAPDAAAETTATCPYPGLLPFDVDDTESFFGRDADVDACLGQLATVGFLAVVGPSGSGKSSLARAGLAAALARDGRRVVIVTPGADPMESLSAVEGLDLDVVLVVDQCEQAVSSGGDAREDARFFAALAEWSRQAPVVVAMRADRLSDATANPEFARLVERGLHLLGPLTEPDLRRAIEGPARVAGLLLEPGLVDLLVLEVDTEPGGLPLLSHALRRTWERREGRVLTVEGYRATGGIRGAIRRTAEDLYEGLTTGQRAELRDLMLRLVGRSVDGEPVCRPVPRRSLAAGTEHDRLVDLLVDARLATSDEGSVQLSHECLTRAWPRLQGWLDDDADGQRILRHLSGAADAWESMGRPDTELFQGVRLRTTLAWRERMLPALTESEHQFLEVARRHADAESARRRRTARRRRLVMAAVAVLAAMAGGAGLLAIRQAERAEVAALTADARWAATRSREADAADRALLLGVEAVRLQDSDESRSALLAALGRSPALVDSYRYDAASAPDWSSGFVAVAPDGERLIAGDGTMGAVHDADTLEAVHTFDGPPPDGAVYRPDGAQFVVSMPTHTAASDVPSSSSPLRLHDAATLEPEPVVLGGWPTGAIEAYDMGYSADGRRLVANLCVMRDYMNWDFTCTATMWDPEAPREPVQSISIGRAWGVELSIDGGLLYVGSYAPALEVYDVATGALLRSIALTPDLAAGSQVAFPGGDTLAMSPDGTTVVVRDLDDVVLVDATTLTERARLSGHAAPVQAITFSHDGRQLATAAVDGTLIVWDLATGLAAERLAGHAGSVRALAFDPGDDTLYSAAGDVGLLAWDLRGDRRFIPRLTLAAISHGPEPRPVPILVGMPAPDGEAVAYVQGSSSESPESSVRFLDVATGQLGDTVAVGASGWAWRPPGSEQFATGDDDGFVRIWDRRRGRLLSERRVAATGVVGVTYTTAGDELVVLDRTASMVRVDARTLEPIGDRLPLGDGAETASQASDFVAIAPDGRVALALLGESQSAWVDLADGRIVRRGDLGLEPARASVSPDGRSVAVAANTGEVGLLDVESWAWVRRPVAAHVGSALGVSWAPDGTRFSSSGQDGHVHLWDARTAELLATVRPGPDSWTLTNFLPDGHTLIIATNDLEVFSWDTRLETWVQRACTLAGRNLTTDEWRDAFDDRPYRETCPAG